VLRFAGIGSMAVLAVFVVAVVMAMTGGPQAPFTRWAGPQAPASGGKHGGDQALTRATSAPGASGTPNSGAGPGGGATTPGAAKTGSPSATAGPKPSKTSPAPTSTSPAASTAAHGHNGKGGPHSTASPTPTA
jgi:hypothetical protein